MKGIIRIAAIAGLTALAVSCSQSVESVESVQPSSAQQTAAQAWMTLVDEGRYSESWRQSSSIFQLAIAETDWIQKVRQARAPIGGVLSRNRRDAIAEKNPAGAPDGDYLIITYGSSFEKKADAIETFTLYQEADGSWRAVGYYIR